MLKKLFAAGALFAAVGFSALATPAAADAQVANQQNNGGWHGGYYGPATGGGTFSRGNYWRPDVYQGTNGRTYIGTYSYPGYSGGVAPYAGNNGGPFNGAYINPGYLSGMNYNTYSSPGYYNSSTSYGGTYPNTFQSIPGGTGPYAGMTYYPR